MPCASPEFSYSIYHRSIHQLVTIYKTNKKTIVVFYGPSDSKISFFLEDLELRAAIISIKNIVYCLVLASLLWNDKRDPSFLKSKRFLPIMIKEGGFYFGNDDLLFLLRNCLPDRVAAMSVFLLY